MTPESRSFPPPASPANQHPWPNLQALIDCDGEITIGRIARSIDAATACDEHTTYAMLQRNDGETEQGQEKPPWRERKVAYLAEISTKSREALLVSCADKLHNARSILFDFDRIGDQIWDRFNAGKNDSVWYCEELAKAFDQAWPENPLLPEFKASVQRLREAAHSAP